MSFFTLFVIACLVMPGTLATLFAKDGMVDSCRGTQKKAHYTGRGQTCEAFSNFLEYACNNSADCCKKHRNSNLYMHFS